MPARIFDTHAHINYPQFIDRMDEVISQCRDVGVEKIVAIATDLESSRTILQLADKYPQVYAVPGWHPCDCLNAPEDIREELLELAKHPKVVAIGETGLDFYRLPSQSDPPGSLEEDEIYKLKQLSLFDQQIEVAAELGLNLVIHQRSAFEETYERLKPWSDRVRGVFHCFVGTPDQQARLQQINSLVSFTGIITFKNAEEVRETVRATPIDQLMLETDCPYLAPVPYRGKLCQPHHVFHVAATIAAEKNVTLEELGEITCRTAASFFRGLDG